VTVPVQSPVVDYTPSGVGPYPVPFRFDPGLSSLKVLALVNGAWQELAATVSASGATLAAAPPAGATLIRLERHTPVDQPAAFRDLAALSAGAIEAAFDRRALVDQEQARDHQLLATRALSVPAGEPTSIPGAPAGDWVLGRVGGAWRWLTGLPQALVSSFMGSVLLSQTSHELARWTAGSFTVSNVAALRSLSNPSSVVTYVLAGHQAADDGGGGTFRYDPSDTSTPDNGGTVIVNPLTGARFKRQERIIETAHFGVLPGRSASDNRAAFAAALAACGLALTVTPATAAVEIAAPALVVPDDVTIRGFGRASHLKWVLVTGTGAPAANAQSTGFVLGARSMAQGLRVELPGLKDSPANNNAGHGFLADGKPDVTVESCIISGHHGSGVLLRNCPRKRVQNNTCYAGYYAGGVVSPPIGNSMGDIVCYSFNDQIAGNWDHGGIITGNYCLSNNSHGIWIDMGGWDRTTTVIGNICITLSDDLAAEVTVGNLRRRHGISTGYGGPHFMESQLIVQGNICANTLVSGIYHAASSDNAIDAPNRAVIIIGNVCARNGYAAAGAPDATLSGAISVLGGGAGDVVLGNTIIDYKGAVASDVGAITINHSIVATGVRKSITVANNSINRSTSHGIVMKGEAIGEIDLSSNRIEGCVGSDIYLVPGGTPGANNGPIRIINPRHKRINMDAPSIYITNWADPAAPCIEIVNPSIEGAGMTASAMNAAIRFDNLSKVRVTGGGTIRNIGLGYFSPLPFSGRSLINHGVSGVTFKDVTAAFFCYGLDPDRAGLVIADDCRYENVINRHTGGSGWDISMDGRVLSNDRVEVYRNGSPPDRGTFALGDQVVNISGVVGQPRKWTCSTAGNAGSTAAFTSWGNL
jgi:hypothetical protein